MKCPRCGAEMALDSHRKIPLMMCYECGYIEGRNMEGEPSPNSNFAKLKGLNLNETAAYLSAGLKSAGMDVDVKRIVIWLMDPAN